MSTARKSLLGSTLLLSGFTLLSRLFGLVREQAFSALFGASANVHSDGFRMAFRLPNLLRDLFAEGALSAAFQPTFAQRWKQGSMQDAYELANRVISLLLVVVGAITLLGIVVSPHLVSLWAKGYSSVSGKAALTTQLARILMPFLLLISISSVWMAMLNVQQKFAWPAVAPVLFNLASIVTGVVLWLIHGMSLDTKIKIWAWSTLFGGFLQLAIQLPPLWKSGYRFRFLLDLRFSDPGVRQILRIMAPAILGLMALQINLFVNSSLASNTQGAVSWLEIAFRLMQLPLGLFGVAVGTVVTTRYAQSSAEDAEQTLVHMRVTLLRGIHMVVLLTLPCAVGLFLLADVLIRTLYQRGDFTYKDTLAAASALRWYTVGLVPYAMVKVIAPAFYALKNSRIPVLASLASVAVNIAISFLCYSILGFRALALGIGVSALCNALVLLFCFQFLYKGLIQKELGINLLKVFAAASGMGLVLFLASHQLFAHLSTPLLQHKTSHNVLFLAVATLLGMASYFVLCRLLRVKESTDLLLRIRAKLKRR